METRNISLTLEKAKEWYNSGSANLKEVALQAYSEQELKTEDWERIKTFKDACKALGINSSSFNLFGDFGQNIRDHLKAIYKLDIIRQALNKGYEPSLVHGTVYYPCIRFYKVYDDAINLTRELNNWGICGEIKIKGISYYLVGGAYGGSDSGLGNFICGSGNVFAALGLLCCKSKEIAQHMSKYFAKEIFDAIYIQHNNYE